MNVAIPFLLYPPYQSDLESRTCKFAQELRKGPSGLSVRANSRFHRATEDEGLLLGKFKWEWVAFGPSWRRVESNRKLRKYRRYIKALAGGYKRPLSE